MKVNKVEYYCDKCNKQVDSVTCVSIPYKWTTWGVIQKEVDLCTECLHKYFETVKPFVKENKNK